MITRTQNCQIHTLTNQFVRQPSTSACAAGAPREGNCVFLSPISHPRTCPHARLRARARAPSLNAVSRHFIAFAIVVVVAVVDMADCDDLPSCPSCQMPLALFTPREAEAHVNACLDSKQAPALRSHPVSDSRPPPLPSSRNSRDDTNSATTSDRPRDHDVSTSIPLCGVCGRDLSRLTESARAEHANRCADSVLPLPPRRARGTGQQQQQEEQPASSRLSRRNNNNSRRRRDQGGATTTAATAARDGNTANSNGESEEEEPKGDPRVEHLLSMLGLQRYVKRFVAEEIDLVALRLLNDDDLAALSIPEAARRRIADAMHSVPILAQLQLQQTSTGTVPTVTHGDERNEPPLIGTNDGNMNQSTESKQKKKRDEKELIGKQQEKSNATEKGNATVIEGSADADVNVDGNVEQEQHEELNTDFIAPTQQFTRSRLATRMRRTAGALLDTSYSGGGNDGDFDDLDETYNPTPLPPPVVRRPVEFTTTDAISNPAAAAAAAAAATVAATATVTAAATTDVPIIETDPPPSPILSPAPDVYKPEDAKDTSLQHRAAIDLELTTVPKAGPEPVSGLGNNPPTPPPVAHLSSGPAPFCDVANSLESQLLPVPPRDGDAEKRRTTHQLNDSYNSQVFLSPPARNDDSEIVRTTKTKGHRQKKQEPKIKHGLRQHNDVDAYHLGDGADERSVNLTMCESRPEGEDKHGNGHGREQIRIFIEDALHGNGNDKKHRDRDRNIDMETLDRVDGAERDRFHTHQQQRSQPSKSISKSKSKSKLERSRHSGGDGCNNSSNESSSSSRNSMASLASDLGDLHRVAATQSQISVEGLLVKWRHRLISREQRRHRDELDRIERDYRNALGQTLLTRRRRRRSDNGDVSGAGDEDGDEQSRSPVRYKKKPRSPPSFADSFRMSGGGHYNAYDINGSGVEDRNGNSDAGYECDRVLQCVRNNRQSNENDKDKDKDKEMEGLKPPTLSRRSRRRDARLSVGKPLGDMYPASQVNADEHDNNGKEWVKAREEFSADSPAHLNANEDENDVIDLTQMAVTMAADVERDAPQAHAHPVKEKEKVPQQKRQPEGKQQKQRHERSQHDRAHDDACHVLNVDADDIVLISSSGSPPIVDDHDEDVNHNQHRVDIANTNNNSDHDNDAQADQAPQLSVLESPTIQREIASVLRRKPPTETDIDPVSRPGLGEGSQGRHAVPNSPSSSSSFEPIDLARITRSRNLSRRRFGQGRHDDNDDDDDDEDDYNDSDMRHVDAGEEQNEEIDKNSMESGVQPKSLHAKTKTKTKTRTKTMSARSLADASGTGDDDKNEKISNSKNVEGENDDNEEDDNNKNGDDDGDDVLDLVNGGGDTAANNEFGERMDLDGNDEQEQGQEDGQEEEGTQSRLKRKRKTKAKPNPPPPKKKVTDADVIEAIRGDQALYQDVLMMRCVSLSRFSKCLQDADVKLSKAGLHGFLLRQGVMFKSDSNGAKPTQSQQQFMRALNSDTRELSD